jgi:hypothetical protein
MSSHQIIVTGVLPPSGQIQARKPVRKNIKDLIQDEKQFSLYIQAMRMFPAIFVHELSSKT